MKIYPKILLFVLALILISGSGAYLITATLSRQALIKQTQNLLQAELARAVKLTTDYNQLLIQYGLGDFPANVRQAQFDATSELKNVNIGEQGYIFAVDKQGLVVSHPDVEQIGSQVDQEPWFQKMQTAQSGGGIIEFQGTSYIAEYQYFSDWGWYLLAVAPEAEVFQPVNQALRLGVLLIALVSGFVMALLAWLTKLTLRPLQSVSAGAAQIGQGIYEINIPITSQDEIGDLASVFNQTAKQIKENITATRQSEERYTTLFNQAADGIFITDLDGNYISVNEKACLMLGYTLAEILQMNLRDLIVPESSPIPAQLDELKSGKTVLSERNLRHKDGRSIPVEISAKMVDGNKLQGITRDITDRKQAEVALQQSELKYRRLHETMTDAFTLVDMAGRILECNLTYREMLGYTEAELRQLTYQDVTPEKWHAIESRIVQEEILLHGFSGVYEKEYRRKDGSIFPVELRVSLVRDDAGQPMAMSGIVRDITDRKQAEDALRASENFRRLIVDTEPECVKLIAPNGGLIEMNSAGLAMIEADSFEQVKDTPMIEIVAPEYRDSFGNLLKRVMRGESGMLEFEIIGLKDTRRWLETHAVPLRNTSNQIEALLGVTRDITERKQAEETIQQYAIELERRVEERTIELIHANRAKDEFLANMSHELRTPLNAILNISESLHEGVYGQLQPRQAEVLHIIAESGRHLLNLIKDILDLSKIEAGKLELLVEPVTVDLFCEASMRMINEVAFLKHLRVSVSNTSNIEVIHADERRLKQMLVNLLGNAVKFTPAGGEISLDVSKEGVHAIRFSVRDNGIGIPAGQLNKLFKPFVQLDSSLARQYPGTGLGLSLVRNLAELHGGSVGVESEPGKGSCFYFIVPIQSLNIPIMESAIPSGGLKPIEKSTNQSGENRRILLVEDNVTNMLVTSDYLNDKGYQVIGVRDGLEAIQQAQEQKPDLILMDIQMPGMNGIETIKHLRTMPEYGTVPIIALTALAMPGDRERCLNAGANEYLTKPVSLKELIEMIENLL